MKTALQGLISCVFLLFLAGAEAAQHTKATLLLSHDAARPGETITAALKLNHGEGWHTYWRNPGDAGIPTSVDWDPAPGLAPGEIQWPVPDKSVLIGMASYSYEGEVLLLVPVRIAEDAPEGPVTLSGTARWLECKDLCLMGSAPVSATLQIGPESKPSASAALIDTWRQRLPKKNPEMRVLARWEGPAADGKRPLLIEWTPHGAPEKPDFFPYAAEGYALLPETEVLQGDSQIVTIRKHVQSENGWPSSITGILLDRSEGEYPPAYEVTLEIPEDSALAVPAAATAGPAAGFEDASIWMVLAFAFLGGIILNIMPCVLPVLALKILSIVKQSGAEPRRARQFGLLYTAGVLASFLVLAGFIIIVQRAQGVASWGMQFQNPVFVVCLTLLVTLISLNLFGVFEITLGGRTMGTAGQLASREGKSGAFFHGVLATILGTSCTAPFLFFAIGYALTQTALVTILVFLMIGLGLAFPYLALTWNPRLMRLLPKPGAWMERFKVAMGFPMLATAAWLFYVALHAHFGSAGALWLGLFLVLMAFAAWVWGEFVQRGRKRRPLAMGISAATILFAFFFILEGELRWRSPAGPGESMAINNDPEGIQWRPWSREAVAEARAAGHPVLVDFTAVYCLNCQLNKRTSIEIDPVRKKLKEIGAVAFIADFSGQDPVIARELQRFGRNAVPLVLVYPPGTKGSPEVLPPMLTPNIVLNALDKAANGAESMTGELEKRVAAQR